ncbi:MAG: hypothetical protein M3Z03_01225 [Actinomycetota bacterium]|nr:hypothetical protein [Actinomycetota bacterium]
MALHLRCSPALRQLGVDPIGSATSGTSYLLVDLPLPWQGDIGDDPRLDELHAFVRELAAAGHRWRVQATVPREDGVRRVVAYELPHGPASGFLRRELTAGPGEELHAAMVLLQEVGIQGVGADPSPGGDFLLCTHGSRDVCCGGSGTVLWRELVERAGSLPDELALGRTSHTGGHRFAPTALSLPTGTMWAWLDVAQASALTDRRGVLDELLAHYRGSCLMRSTAEQVVEREAFRTIGWGWLEHRRSATTIAAGEDTIVELAYEAPDGRQGRFVGRTRVVGSAPVPPCGEPLEQATKSSPVLELVGSVEHHS